MRYCPRHVPTQNRKTTPLVAIAVLEKPIILLGFHRSGTTLLGRVFSKHPEIAYLAEPRHVWMHSFPFRRYDILTTADAQPNVVKRIHREFGRFLSDSGSTRFAEKTPSNMVRLPFIFEAMPDCKVIHIIRDGRASTFSTLEVLKRSPSARMIKRRATAVPWWHYPSYFLKVWRNLVVPKLTGRPIPYWGPRVPGLRDRVQALPPDEMCAWQWQETLQIARRDASVIPASQYREWLYEDLVQDPERVVREMFTFVELDFPGEISEWLFDHINKDSLNKWRHGLSPDAISRITPHLEPLLSELGYD